MNILKEGTDVKPGNIKRECEELWAKNKYYVLSKSHKTYLEIREYLKEKEVDTLFINEKIERVLANVNNTNLQNKIEEYDKEIKSALYEKAKISGELTKEGSKLKGLIKAKENLENTLNSNTKTILSPSARKYLIYCGSDMKKN